MPTELATMCEVIKALDPKINLEKTKPSTLIALTCGTNYHSGKNKSLNEDENKTDVTASDGGCLCALRF